MSDFTNYEINPDYEPQFITAPTYTWKCELHKDTWWHVEEGKQPNAFHRFMQRLCFGFKWEKIDE